MGHELPAPRCPRYASLDLWRGVACLAVVIHHATLFSPFWAENRIPEANRGDPASWVVAATSVLWLGVPLFFVISGYCIAATADATRRRSRPLADYFVRRVRRIYPPYWAAVLLLVLLVAVVERRFLPGLWTSGLSSVPVVLSPSQVYPVQWLGNLTLTETWRPHLFGGDGWYFHAMMWTLCYEEQFYAVVGLLLWLVPRRFFLGAVVVTAAAVAARWLLPRYGLPVDGFFFDGYWTAFAAGLLVYYAINYAGQAERALCVAALGVGLIGFAYDHFPIRSPHCNVGEGTVVALAFALLLLALHRWDARLAAARLTRPLTFCGTICYSLYLIHWPVVRGLTHLLYRLGLRDDTATVLVTVPLCVAASVGAAWLFHVAVERRFLNARR